MKVNDLEIKRAAGVLIYAQKSEEFLLLRRSSLESAPLTWGLPGGMADGKESPWKTICRECLEEIGYDLAKNSIRFTKIWTQSSKLPNFSYVTLACMVEKKFEPKLNWEHDDYVWTKLDDLPSPQHLGLTQLLNHDMAAERLHNFIIDKKPDS